MGSQEAEVEESVELNASHNSKYVPRTGALNIAFSLGGGGQRVTTVIKMSFASSLGSR